MLASIYFTYYNIFNNVHVNKSIYRTGVTCILQSHDSTSSLVWLTASSGMFPNCAHSWGSWGHTNLQNLGYKGHKAMPKLLAHMLYNVLHCLNIYYNMTAGTTSTVFFSKLGHMIQLDPYQCTV